MAEPPAQKARKPTKNEQRRAKKRAQKHQESDIPAAQSRVDSERLSTTPDPKDANANKPLQPIEPAEDDAVQSIPAVADFTLDAENPFFEQFKDVLQKFEAPDEEPSEAQVKTAKPEVFYDDDDVIQSEDEEEATQQKLSKKARKKANKLSVAELKAIVRKPEIVDWTDPSAQDPRLLVNIKSARNVVPVPTHWSLKREYLSSKRGIEKPGFALPKFIAETGIMEMRAAVLEKQEEASLKSRQRERVQPKMGRLDIDYQKLYEAFFRRQTKPQLTRYGEVYYEGKEYETNLRHLRPGELSDELREALNMPPGAAPPWLLKQQQYGPPPSYPAMRIQGLNAPPPPGAAWGFHPGGYGKPPLDDKQRPMWGGDVFGVGDTETSKVEAEDKERTEAVDKSLWGELQPIEDSDEEEEDDEEDDEDGDGSDEDADGAGLETPSAGTDTPAGTSSTLPREYGGTQTQNPGQDFSLRKNRSGTETETTDHPRSAGQVLGERQIRAEGFFGGERAYDLSNSSRRDDNIAMLGSNQEAGRKRKAGDLDVSVDLDALHREDRLSKAEVKRRYDEQAEREKAGGWHGKVDQEDLTQMIAEESAKRQRRDADRGRRR
ncbi:DUF382-domain-containing protein [Polychaeton citri CBS 116435]|uniref:DUF382-domain-containing protein n=1 Tax=Polychaeton citri CBS 116435 TaxID=1314669 RepID=A0A9P4Q1S9_9PEZI|nr:DUF382-domain-containing protein [Polychaeton citri CBS 116435]